jgi:hypothetical protein
MVNSTQSSTRIGRWNQSEWSRLGARARQGQERPNLVPHPDAHVGEIGQQTRVDDRIIGQGLVDTGPIAVTE